MQVCIPLCEPGGYGDSVAASLYQAMYTAPQSFHPVIQQRSLVRCRQAPSNHALPAATKNTPKIPPIATNQLIGANAPTNIPVRTPPIPQVTPANKDERANTLDNLPWGSLVARCRNRTDDAAAAGRTSNFPTLPRSQPALPFRSRHDTVPARLARKPHQVALPAALRRRTGRLRRREHIAGSIEPVGKQSPAFKCT